MTLHRFGIVLWVGLCFLANNKTAHADLKAGAGMSDLTPREFEQYISGNKYKNGDPFFDTGVDRLFDFEEQGALGKDSKPGVKGIDDDGNGKIDDCDRLLCKEYLFKGSDDLKDPAQDNYDKKKNPYGTERDGKIQTFHVSGFSPYIPTQKNRMVNGIHDPIWARALVFEKDGRKIVLVSTDLPGVTWKNINPVRRRIAREFGIPVSNIVISSNHNHQAPDAAGYWSTLVKGHNDWFMARVREGTYQAIRRALLKVEPVRMKTITTYHDECYDPKTHELKKVWQCKFPKSEFDFEAQPGVFDAWILQRDMRDPIVLNTRIVASQFVSRETGKTVATFVNWSDHPETFASENTLISSDFPHYLREFVEAKIGGTAVYFSGTVGCQIGALRGLEVPAWSAGMTKEFSNLTMPNGQPFPELVTNGEAKVRSIGYEIGNDVVSALEKAPFDSESSSSPFWIRTDSLLVAITNPVHEVLTGSVWRDGVEAPDKTVRNLKECFGIHGCVRTDVSVLQIGDLSLATSPGEMDPSYFYGREESEIDYGEKGIWTYKAQPGFESYMPGKHHAVIGQANNYLSYLVHRHDNLGWLNKKHPNHYEEMVTVGFDFGDDVGNRIHEMLGSAERYSDPLSFPRLPWRNPIDRAKVAVTMKAVPFVEMK